MNGSTGSNGIPVVHRKASIGFKGIHTPSKEFIVNKLIIIGNSSEYYRKIGWGIYGMRCAFYGKFMGEIWPKAQ